MTPLPLRHFRCALKLSRTRRSNPIRPHVDPGNAMIPLQQIQIKSPCHKSWTAMDGDDQKRYCEGCRKDVFNLSAMTSADAQGVIDAHSGNLCVRFDTRSDGSIRTVDSPLEPRQRKQRYAPTFGWAVALIVAGIIGLPGVAVSAPQLKHPSTKHSKPLQLLGEPTLPPTTATAAHGTFETPKRHTPPRPPALMGKMAAPPIKAPAKPSSTAPKHTPGSATTPQNREMLGDIAIPASKLISEPPHIHATSK